MTKERYCSYEVAKLLKEKWFDVPCSKAYMNDSMVTKSSAQLIDFNSNGYVSKPTHQMAMDWLREKHQLHISIDISPIYGKVKDEKGRNTCGLLYWHYMASGEWMNDKYNPQQKAFVVSEKSHKKAVEEALKYSLENLI